jgi:hypothetical protein
MKRASRHPLFAALALVLALVLLEAGAGLINYLQGEQFFPQEQERVVNNLGFRPPDIPVPKPRGTYRVCALGDSFTWGATPVEETYPTYLEHRLRALCPERAIEVVNCGLPARTTISEISAFLGTAPSLEPDLVLLQLLDNDLEPMDDFFFYGMPRWARHLRMHPVFGRSAVIRFFWRYVYLPIWYRSYAKQRDAFREPGTPTWRRTFRALSRLVAWSRRERVPVYAWFHPSTEKRVEGESPRLTRVLLDAVEELGIPTADPTIAYWQHFSKPSETWCSSIEHHPNAASNRFIADWLADWIGPIVCRAPE